MLKDVYNSRAKFLRFSQNIKKELFKKHSTKKKEEKMWLFRGTAAGSEMQKGKSDW